MGARVDDSRVDTRGGVRSRESMASKKRNYLTLEKKVELIKHVQKKTDQREGSR